MTETIEQITERAKCDAESIVDDLPESLTAQGQMWNDGFETGYVQGVIAEATRDRWIKVETALPEEGQRVLCWNDQDDIGPHRIIIFGSIASGFPAYVTHWMPLPSPPTSPTT